MEKIWRDIHIRRIIYFFLSIGFISFIIYYNIYKEAKQNEIILSFLIGIYFIFLLFNTLRVRLTYIYNQGIRIGNAPNDSYDNFIFVRKAIFIKWADLKSVKIVRRETHRPLHDVLINYILIKTKDGKKYESFVANPKGFLKTIKNLKKEKLISKDSKYIDNNNYGSKI